MRISKPRRRSHLPLRLESLDDRNLPSAYMLTDLGTLGGVGANAFDINDAGQVAGSSNNAAGVLHGFFWQNGTMTDLGTLGGNISWANGLNNDGQVVGASRLPGNTTTGAFLWEGGALTNLGANLASAAEINDSGRVVGTQVVDSRHRAFAWQNGVLTDLGAIDFGGGGYSTANDINNAGLIVGHSAANGFGPNNPMQATAVLWQNGAINILGTLPGDDESTALAVNGLGQIAGQSSFTDFNTYEMTTRSFVWHNGAMTDLGVPATESAATDINDAGQVVGVMRVGSGVTNPLAFHAYIYENGVVTNLNTLVAAGSGLTLTYAQGINNAGQIAATGVDAAGKNHAVLLTPAPANLPAITINDVSQLEGNSGTTNFSFTVSLSTASTSPVTVVFATGNGTGVNAIDYLSTTGTLTFAPGETTKTISVPVNGDRVAEANETFTVTLSQPTQAIIIDNQGVGTIVDDEPRITISDMTKLEGNSGSTSFAFTVSLSKAYDAPVAVNFGTANGSASAGQDYTAKSGTLTFAPGETTKTVTIAVNGDKKRESNETFFVNLSGAVGALILDPTGIGTILNDDHR